MIAPARLRVYAPDGTTARTADVGAGAGVLPTQGLSFSVEVGGGGGITFRALYDHLDDLDAWDSVLRLDVYDPGATAYVTVAAYALRPPFRRDRVGKQLVDCTGVSLLEQWASEAVVLPEYGGGTIPRGAGTDRAIGWMATAYDPSADATEAWGGIYEVSAGTRATYPTDSLTVPGSTWPSGSGAAWVSITGATDTTERKLFRTATGSDLTIATAGPVRCFVASDSPGTLYIAGEPVLEVQGGEPGREPILFEQVDMWMAAGSFACAFDTMSVWDSGGDGVDPVIIAICTLDADGDPDTWLLVSNDTDWVACRRDDEPPDNEPPGPTPGALIDYMVTEAADRGCSGWAGVTISFDAADDTYEAAWPGIVVERLLRYGSDTLWSAWQALAESAEVDTWMDYDLTLNAAPHQGVDRTATSSLTLDEATVATMSDTRAPTAGTWVAALALDGWVTGSTGSVRREYGMELGTAISRAVADRVVAGALAEVGRWDGSCRLAPGGIIPLVDFDIGDTLPCSYQDAPASVRVLSASATAADGSLLWDLELTDGGE